MEYKEFTEMLQERFTQFLPTEYQGWEVKISRVPKVNGYLDCLNLLPGEQSEPVAIPNIYTQEWYAYYQEHGDVELVLEQVAEYFLKSVEYVKTLSPFTELAESKENVIMELVNYQANRELLSGAPGRRIMDLAIIYRLMVKLPDNSFNSAIITDSIASEMKLKEEELYEIAMENTPKLLPVYTEEICEDFYLLTNTSRTLGATAMVYPQALENLSLMAKSDLFILPSSIHELFIIPDYMHDPKELRHIVMDANANVVDAKDILSNHVYFFERGSGKLRML